MIVAHIEFNTAQLPMKHNVKAFLDMLPRFDTREFGA